MGLKINWETKYSKINCNVKILGLLAAEEETCRAYLVKRVMPRLIESDASEVLKQHIMELSSTGFSCDNLLDQIQPSPKAKDWEIGEAFAATVLEDEHEAMFPWPTAFDKRMPKASLPGADLVGFHRYIDTRFVFGQVKSTSEKRTPPQIVSTANDCLKKQMFELRHNQSIRQQLLSWLLVRTKDNKWEAAFNEALERYSNNDVWLVGVLVNGDRQPSESDLSGICADLEHNPGYGEVQLMGFYIPFHKDEWVNIVYSEETNQ